MRLWHGGAPGRAPGDRLLPPAETGVYSRREISIEEGLDHIRQRADRVYATTDRNLARAWAGLYTPDGRTYTGGALYTVTLDEPVEVDEDLPLLEGRSVQAPAGVIVAVYDTHVRFQRDRHLRVLQRVLDDHANARRARD